MNKKVLVAMSGGVDSSLAAYFLLKKGYDVSGLFMQLSSSGQAGKLEKVLTLTAELNIPLFVLDLTENFKHQVIEYFQSEYRSGRTPNPCIVCNQRIKFKYLLKKAEDISADYVSSGHYAKVEYNPARKDFFLKQGLDKTKDQSYMLFGLNQQWLSRIVFPLGGHTKKEVTILAKKLNLESYYSPESQDICFSGTRQNLYPGPIIDKQGNILGSHDGIVNFTVGQRKGLGLASDKPLYVTQINTERNAVLVGDKTEVNRDELLAGGLNWLTAEQPSFPFRAQVKIRYKHPKSWATVSKLSGGRVKVKFDLAQPAPTPGQAAVLYEQETVLGGGWIE